MEDSMTAAKAFTAAVTAFLGFAASKGIELPWSVEGTLIAAVAAVAVYVVPNRRRGE